jgi:hypothetical protein
MAPRIRIGSPRRRAGALLLAAAAVALAAGCGGDKQESRRVVEREDTVAGRHVRLRSEITPARATLGDRVAWRLSATLDGIEKLEGPLMGEKSAALDLDLGELPAVRWKGGRTTWSRGWVIRGYDLGPVPLPLASLVIPNGARPDTLAFPPDTLFVDSLTQAASGSLRPDRGPISPGMMPLDWAVIGAVVIAVIGALLALVLAWRRARRRESGAEPESAPPDPPEAVFERALAALRSEIAILPRDRFYEQLSLALRRYAADVTGITALDLTTGELDRDLLARADVPAEGRRVLIAALRRADLAKFGRYADPREEAEGVLRDAASVSGGLRIPVPAPGAPADAGTD